GHFIAALEPDDTVIGGGNVKLLGALPPHSRAGDNENAFSGGFRLWQPPRRHAYSKRRSWTMREGVRKGFRHRRRTAPDRPTGSAHGKLSNLIMRESATAICGTCSRVIPGGASE